MSPKKHSWMGIDPGASGAIVVLRSRREPATLRLSKVSLAEAWAWIKEVAGEDYAPFCVLERVGGYVSGSGGEGEKGGGAANGSAMFKFGRGYGNLEMALIAAGILYKEVVPFVWQPGVGIPPRRKKKGAVEGETKTEFKQRLRARAEELFPGRITTADLADAFLIAEYCRRYDRENQGSKR